MRGQNDVEGRPDWYFGLWTIHGEGKGSVTLYRHVAPRDQEVVGVQAIELERVDYMDRHAIARRAIESAESKEDAAHQAALDDIAEDPNT